MLLTNLLLAFLATCQIAWGFFPWMPRYRCVQDHTCVDFDSDPDNKRSESGAAKGDVADSLKLIQRVSQDDIPHDIRIRRLAGRLAWKYQRGTPVQHHDGDVVDKRDNIYNIVSATPPTQSNSAGIDQDGSDYSYFAEVSLGTSDTPYHMLLDTGAGQTWVMGDTCTSSPCKSHNTFGPGDSTTYQAVPKDFKIEYGTGDVAGVQVIDDVGIAGFKLSMTFGVANKTSDQFNSFPIDGILGLNQQKSQTPNFLQVLAASKLLKSNIFGVSISRASDGANNGAINFGQPDTSKYSGDLSYTSVSTNAQNDWAIPIDDLGVGDKKSGITDTLAYIDTGTSFIFCDADDAKTFHALIPGATVASDGVTYHVPCTTTDSAFFTFSGVTYQVSSKDWVGPKVNDRCTSNIYGYPVVPGAWLLGDTFLKNVYAVFDVDRNRVGLVPANAAPSVTSSTATTSSPTGGPISISSSTSLSSSASAALSESASASAGTATTGTKTVSETSNRSPTGSSSGSPGPSSTKPASFTTVDSSDSSTPTGSPGLNGHQTMESSDTPNAESATASHSGPAPSTTPKSSSVRLNTSLCGPILSLLGLMILT